MSTGRATILVVDDEPSVADLLSEDLAEEGHNCITAITGEDALKSLFSNRIDAVLLDLKLPDISGMDILKEVKTSHPETAVIVVTSTVDAQTAVEAMKIGAVDYITKPFELERINSSIEAALKVDWIRYLDKIAEGVETRLDSLTGHVMTIAVIDETISVARSLDIPEGQIEKWADGRQEHVKRDNILDSFLEKAKQNCKTHCLASLDGSGANCSLN
jgi:DNA-binding NtrC family response regulator